MVGKLFSGAVLFSSALAAADTKAFFFESKFGTDAFALNQSGVALGFREHRIPAGGSYYTQMYPVVWDKGTPSKKAPIVAPLENYSAYTAYGINEQRMVVGRAIGRGGGPSGSEAFYWTEKTGSVALGYLPEGTDSAAHGIAGARIVGQSNKKNGGRFPCVWNLSSDLPAQWKTEELPKAGREAFASAISPDGNWIAGEEDNRPVAWNFREGRWLRIEVSNVLGGLRAINNRGEAAGYLMDGLEPLATYFNIPESKTVNLAWGAEHGYEGSDAIGINSDGTVVGNQKFGRDSDAFIWKKTDKAPKRFRLAPDGTPLIATASRDELEETDAEVLARLTNINDAGVLLGRSTKQGQEDEVSQMFLLEPPLP